MNRSTIRELAFKFLYEIEIQKDISEEQINLYFENNEINSNDAKDYIIDMVNGIEENKDEILKVISNNLKEDWNIERLSKVNIALLKLGVYEILYKKLPYKVVINEVVELAKKYGEDNSSVFINGVLASVVKGIE